VKVTPSRIEGCFEVHADRFRDARGELVKLFQKSAFEAAGLATAFVEDFHSTSRKGVLRGLHFQAPPRQQFKLVHCVEGRVFDVILDIRPSSPTYGQFETYELSEEKSNGVFLPPGVAHGFYVLSDQAVLTYKVTDEHAPSQDVGILWSSIGIPWPDTAPLISERDAALPAWQQFATPFQ
jgi:dTDP-4-dehydrorhamnose 3,5-epimerase